MEHNLDKKSMWNDAGRAGLVLGAVSIAYLFATQFLAQSEIPLYLSSTIILVLRLGKILLCVWLMAFFMKRFALENPEAGNSDTRKFGIFNALLSAFVYSAASFANNIYLSPDIFEMTKELMVQMMEPSLSMMDSNATAEFNRLMDNNFAQMMFISEMSYCFVFGLILALIFSRNIPSRNSLTDYKSEE